MIKRWPVHKVTLVAATLVSGLLWHLGDAPVVMSAATDAFTPVTFPLAQDSTRFAIIGDSGTGQVPQRQVADQMMRTRETFPFTFVLMMGDNIYGSHGADDMRRKFDDPYNALLGAGVKFYASLGNHDKPTERFYAPFNMGGKRYYNFTRGNAEFFALDSTYMDPAQLDWLRKSLSDSTSPWKICFFHHPLYSNARYHGPDLDLRQRLEPMFETYGVSVVLAGHDHVYERLQPQQGIYYFVLGNSGQLRFRNLRPSRQTLRGFDTDQTFAVFEIVGENLYFQTVSRTGLIVDSDVLVRPRRAASAPALQSPVR
jgi:hypothetical protein